MKRTTEEIIAQVLETCLNGSCKTAIVYQNNLNFMKGDLYLDSLMKTGFIAAVDGKYTTTDKGKELLALINDTHESILS